MLTYRHSGNKVGFLMKSWSWELKEISIRIEGTAEMSLWVCPSPR